MIQVDGSFGSGGGQVLRTAVGLSALVQKPCRVFNIRSKRPNPGLREQHLQAVLAVSELCGGKVEGAEIGSTQIEFYPGEIKSRELSIAVSTAGSVGLVLQAVLIPAVGFDLSVRIRGGATYGRWAVPVAYLQNVLSPLLRQMGYRLTIDILREGFYPRGGAEVEVRTVHAVLRPLEILDKGKIISVTGLSVASESLRRKNVAERQAHSASKVLSDYFKTGPRIEVQYSPSLCPGSGIQLWLETERSLLGSSGLGEPGKRAEEVGRKAAEELISEYEGGAVDSHAADQLLPYLALAGGKIRVKQITDHCRTNAFVIRKFLPVKFRIGEKTIEVEKIAN